MMKKITVFVLATGISIMSMAQAQKKPAPAAATQPVLKTNLDSVSYALGLNFANFCKHLFVANQQQLVFSRAVAFDGITNVL